MVHYVEIVNVCLHCYPILLHVVWHTEQLYIPLCTPSLCGYRDTNPQPHRYVHSVVFHRVLIFYALFSTLFFIFFVIFRVIVYHNNLVSVIF